MFKYPIRFFYFLKKFFIKNESKLVVLLATILIAGFSFEWGVLQGQKWQSKPLVIEKEKIIKNNDNSDKKIFLENENKTKNNLNQLNQEIKNNSLENNKKCVFVGSKNSNKYHYSFCRWAKKIKPENRICFSSIKEAQEKGYVPASCIKKKKR